MPYVTAKITNYFFDRKRVLDAIGKKRTRALSRLGAFVRRTAQQSMRKSPRRRRRKAGRKIRRDAQMYSKPGQPPFYYVGDLKRYLFFVYDPASGSVVVGPVPLKGGIGAGTKNGVPALMEYGGQVKRNGKTVTYEPRPFMAPALEINLALAIDLWKE